MKTKQCTELMAAVGGRTPLETGFGLGRAGVAVLVAASGDFFAPNDWDVESRPAVFTLAAD